LILAKTLPHGLSKVEANVDLPDAGIPIRIIIEGDGGADFDFSTLVVCLFREEGTVTHSSSMLGL
jgi:hypothetical protein